MNNNYSVRPCQFKNDPNPCVLCQYAYTDDCIDMRSNTVKMNNEKLKFETAKEIIEEEKYNLVVKSLRKQFNLEEDLKDVSCKGSGSAHFYEKIEGSYKCKYCGETKIIKDIMDELEKEQLD